MKTMSSAPKIVSRAEWLAARLQHLQREKELTRLRDQISAERRALPWVRVEKDYRFEGIDGRETLADLFDERSQLIVYHFMLGPGWREGCPSCSFLMDHVNGMLVHLAHRDTTFVVASRAPWPEIAAFQRRMGWRFKWVSSCASDFNHDLHVSFTKAEIESGKVAYNYDVGGAPVEELPGISVFCRDESGAVYHTYSSYSRGLDNLIGTYQYLDLTPKGRDEEGLAFSMSWLRHHDRYDADYVVDPRAGYSPPEGSICAHCGTTAS